MATYSVEISGSKNEYVTFAPTRERLRGRWDFRNVSHKDLSDTLKHISRVAPVIPGIVLTLDTTKRLAKRIDPLVETESGRKIMADINSVLRRYQQEFGGEKRGMDASVQEEMSDDNMKEWAYYMRQMIDSGFAQYVPGSTELPKLDEIRKNWVGKRRESPFGNGRPENMKYVDVVEGKKAATTAS
jgi:hypothetical protein